MGWFHRLIHHIMDPDPLELRLPFRDQRDMIRVFEIHSVIRVRLEGDEKSNMVVVINSGSTELPMSSSEGSRHSGNSFKAVSAIKDQSIRTTRILELNEHHMIDAGDLS